MPLTLDRAPECILWGMKQYSDHAASAMQIGEVAKRTALTVDAIRFYERRTLLPKPPRTQGRFRLYSNDDVARLRFITNMQGLGFSLREIGQLLELREHHQEACHEVRDLLATKLKKVRSKIGELKKLERELALDLRKCSRELEAAKKHAPASCPILRTAANGKAARFMLIELLYVPGCPNHQPALSRLRTVLESRGIDAQIRETAIRNETAARAQRFPGSPTIRINGVDTEEHSQQSFGIACRLYSGGTGLPSEEALRRTIAAAARRE